VIPKRLRVVNQIIGTMTGAKLQFRCCAGTRNDLRTQPLPNFNPGDSKTTACAKNENTSLVPPRQRSPVNERKVCGHIIDPQGSEGDHSCISDRVVEGHTFMSVQENFLRAGTMHQRHKTNFVADACAGVRSGDTSYDSRTFKPGYDWQSFSDLVPPMEE